MNASTWALFAFMAALNIVSPGPAVLLSITNAIEYGLKIAVISSLGNIAGLFCLSVAVIFGVSSLLHAYPLLFVLLKVVGAGYLIYVGLRKLRSRENILSVEIQAREREIPGLRRLFKSGFFLAVTNPKPLLFFAAIYPQFIDSQKPLLPQFMILSTTFMIISLVSLTSYGFVSLEPARKFYQVSSRQPARSCASRARECG